MFFSAQKTQAPSNPIVDKEYFHKQKARIFEIYLLTNQNKEKLDQSQDIVTGNAYVCS